MPRALDRLLGWGRWLALPVAVLLFMQWPLRELVHWGSRGANDLAQWLFALYVALAVTAATQAGGHLASDALARRCSPRWRRGLAVVGALALLGWGIVVLATSGASVWRSVVGLEAFPDTGNPFYFMVKLAGFVLALLVVTQACYDALGRD